MNAHTKARKRLLVVAKHLAGKYRDELETRKANYKDLKRSNFLWHYLLQSFATMGRSGGSKRLIADPDTYAQVNYYKLRQLTPQRRISKLQKILSGAKVRWPTRKAVFISGCLDIIEEMGGLSVAKRKLLSLRGRDEKIAFLVNLPGIGNKYARNMMMDVYHEDFRDSIAIDSRIKKISEKLARSFDSYQEEEQFFVDLAHEAEIEGWELDRLMYNHQKEFLEKL